MTKEQLIKIEKEFQDIRKVLVLDSAKGYLLEDKEIINLVEYFDELNFGFAASYAFCYMNPGEILTIKEILVRASKYQLVSEALKDYIKGMMSDEKAMKIAKEINNPITINVKGIR